MSPPNKNLKYVHAYKDRHGKIRYYYRRDRKQVAIKGEFGARAWLDNYSSIHDRFEASLYPRVDSGTFATAVHEYYRSPRFESLKPKTQDNYRRALTQLVESFGNIRLEKITRGGLVKLRDQIASKSPRRAIEAIKVVSLVFERARDLDLVDHNPAKEISRPLGYQADPHRPWSHGEIETFLRNCRHVWRRAIMVLLYTGLRREDAINLQRRHIVNDRIYLSMDRTGDTIRETGAEVVIPIHPRLAEELSTPLPIEGLTLITGTRGRPIRGDVLTNSIRKEAKRLGLTNPPPLHGLRKNAVMRLFEIGCSVEEIHAITGQSHQMIHHYGQAYNRDRLVDSVVVKIERDRTEKR